MFKHGGGIETWANYFFENINLSRGNINKIFIYYINSDDITMTIRTNLINNTLIEWIPIDIGNPIKNNPIKNYLGYAMKVKKYLIKNLNPSDYVFVIGTFMSGLLSLITRKKMLNQKTFKLVVWVRSKAVGEILASRSKIFSWIGSILENSSFLYSDFIITNGKDTLDYFKKKYNKLSYKISMIPNAVDYNNFVDIELTKNSKSINIAYTGRTSSAKGFPEFIESIKITKLKDDVMSSIYFNVYGDVSENIKVLNPEVNFFGAFNSADIKKILAENDVIVFLNKQNQAGGLSHSLLEAMAAGRLIVAWDNEVHNQVLDITNSILVKENDIEKLVDVFLSIEKKGISSFTNLREKARRDANNYSIESHMTRFYDFLNK